MNEASDGYTITVFGSSQPEPGDGVYEAARRLGKAVAEAGWTLCNGGYGGTMAAGCRGAVDAGGKTIGVSCDAFGRSGVNQWVQREITTASLGERLNTLVELGDAYIVLPGSTGTLLELAEVWELTNKRFVSGKPIVLLGDYWKPVLDVIARESPRPLDCLDRVASVDEAIAVIRRKLDS
jgi:hypothetical protein